MEVTGAREARRRAASFVEAHGGALDRARAEALRGGARSGVLARLGWNAEPAAAARRTLGICDDLRLLRDASVEGLVNALARSQAEDGGWAERRPLPERLFETGMIAGHLAKTPAARPEVLGGAAEFLAVHWSPDRVRGGSWQALAAYAHLFANADHDVADAVLQWCGRELGRGFLTGTFDAVRTARVLVLCDAHGLPGAQLGVRQVAAALLAEQEADGGFPAADAASPGGRVEATLDALAALVRLGGEPFE